MIHPQTKSPITIGTPHSEKKGPFIGQYTVLSKLIGRQKHKIQKKHLIVIPS
jgi:hypothetical protein